MVTNLAARRSPGRIVVRHILPNISGQIIVVVSSAFGWAILTGTVREPLRLRPRKTGAVAERVDDCREERAS